MAAPKPAVPIVVSVAATFGGPRAAARRARPRTRPPHRGPPGWPVAAGILAGAAADALLGDPRRGHPVALFGRAAQAVRDRAYADSRLRGAAYAASCMLGAAAPAMLAEHLTRGRPWLRLAATAAAVWTVTGARSLTGEAERIAAALGRGDLETARAPSWPRLRAARSPSRTWPRSAPGTRPWRPAC